MPDTHSLAVIDATDATVLPPESAAAELTPEQEKTLGTCEFQLHRLGRRIAAREVDLIYLYVEYGWYLAKAQAVYVTNRATVARLGDGKFDGLPPGFEAWLNKGDVNVPKRTAYRYIQAATNAGLTAESTPEDVKVLRDAAKLAGQTLTALCRKPVNKDNQEAEVHEVTPEEAESERLESLREQYRLSAEFLAQQVIAEQTWAELSPEEIAAFAGFLADAARVVKAGLKKAKELPAPQPTKRVAAPATVAEIPFVESENEVLISLGEDPIYEQEEADRGLWWYGYRNAYGSDFAHPYRGNDKDLLEAREDLSLVVVGPFYAKGQKAAEKIVKDRTRGLVSRAEQHLAELAAK